MGNRGIESTSHRGEMMDTADANKVMQEANHIIEDFSVSKYAIYLFLFLLETALCFWIALKI